MVFSDGTPKGMKEVLEERGINTSRMVAEDMRTVLSWHDDFWNVRLLWNIIREEEGTERVWGQAKVYSRIRSNFTLSGLRQIINPALDLYSQRQPDSEILQESTGLYFRVCIKLHFLESLSKVHDLTSWT